MLDRAASLAGGMKPACPTRDYCSLLQQDDKNHLTNFLDPIWLSKNQQLTWALGLFQPCDPCSHGRVTALPTSLTTHSEICAMMLAEIDFTTFVLPWWVWKDGTIFRYIDKANWTTEMSMSLTGKTSVNGRERIVVEDTCFDRQIPPHWYHISNFNVIQHLVMLHRGQDNSTGNLQKPQWDKPLELVVKWGDPAI